MDDELDKAIVEMNDFNSKYNSYGEHIDHTFSFGVSELMLHQMFSGSNVMGFSNLIKYCVEQCRDLGYLPWAVLYKGYSQIGNEGKEHEFVLVCQDKRILESER